MEENHDHELISISGFHYAKREKFLIEDLAKREQTVIEQRKALLDEVILVDNIINFTNLR